MGKTRRKEKTFNDSDFFDSGDSGDYIAQAYNNRKKRRPTRERRQHNAFPEEHDGRYEEEDFTSFEKIGKRK